MLPILLFPLFGHGRCLPLRTMSTDTRFQPAAPRTRFLKRGEPVLCQWAAQEGTARYQRGTPRPARTLAQWRQQNELLRGPLRACRRELRQATAQLGRQQVEARQALGRERDLHAFTSRFVNLASHEFRMPMGTIRCVSEPGRGTTFTARWSVPAGP